MRATIAHPQPAALSKEASVGAVLLWLLTLAVPFIQLGISYWVSVQTITFASAAILTLIYSRGRAYTFVPVLALSFAVGAAGMAATDAPTFDDVLRYGREQLVLALYIQLFMQLAYLTTQRRLTAVRWALVFITAGVVGLEIVQFFLIPSGQFPTFPYEWFISNYKTLPSAINFVYSDIRASSSFGEPSYLAFVLSSMFVAMHGYFKQKPLALPFLMVFVGILVCRSLAGYMAIFGLVLAALDRRHRGSVVALCGVVVVLFLITQSSLSEIPVLSRLSTLDSSTYARIVAPLAVLPTFLASYPFGVAADRAAEVLASSAAQLGVAPENLLHNSAANMLLSYGVFGVIVIFSILLLVKNWVYRIYIASCLIFNGAFLAPDKFSIVFLALVCGQLLKSEAPAQLAPEELRPAPSRPNRRALGQVVP